MARRPDGPLRRAGVAALLAVGLGLAGAAAAVHESPRLAAAAAGATTPAVPVTAPTAVGPGTVTETQGAGICTAGFLFRGGGRTLLGQAAHCAGTGPDTETDGCTSSTLPTGAPVTVRGTGGPVAGVLRYSSWVAMQDGGERDPDVCAGNDFALVELPPDTLAGSSLPVLGGPAGIRDTPPVPGGVVHGLAEPTGPDGAMAPVHRPGTLGPDVGDGWLHTVRTTIPGTPGESGGPLVDDRGSALGILSGMEAGGERRLEFTDVARAVAYARTHGAAQDLELVPGTRPFAPPLP